MAQWFYNRPPEDCDETEQSVAKAFERLDDSWIIRWGFYYQGNYEGDFLILGPSGLLVLELKGGERHHDIHSGFWDGRDNPFTQLLATWNGVVQKLNQPRDLYIGHALGLNAHNIPHYDPEFMGIGRDRILDHDDLHDLPAWWRRYFPRQEALSEKARNRFIDAYGSIRSYGATKGGLLSEADIMMERMTSASYPLLDHLEGNSRLVFQGGAGTGKTWLALEQARRWAARGERVLFLVYNLALRDFLAEVAERLMEEGSGAGGKGISGKGGKGGKVAKKKKTDAANGEPTGSITVKSWEELLKEHALAMGLGWEDPASMDRKQRHEFFGETLPGYARLFAEEALPEGVEPFTALVVDEAQDHETHDPEKTSPGWWSFYFRLLRDGADSRVAAFLDPVQRATFQGRSGFRADELRQILPGAARVTLWQPVRYTRKIFKFLSTFTRDQDWVPAGYWSQTESLPDGEEVVEVTVTPDQLEAKLNEIIYRWKRDFNRAANEIGILRTQPDRKISAIRKIKKVAGGTVVEGAKPRADAVRTLSAYKAKGLEFSAVVVLDELPAASGSAETAAASHAEALFLAATRARHLLAIVRVREEEAVSK